MFRDRGDPVDGCAHDSHIAVVGLRLGPGKALAAAFHLAVLAMYELLLTGAPTVLGGAGEARACSGVLRWSAFPARAGEQGTPVVSAAVAASPLSYAFAFADLLAVLVANKFHALPRRLAVLVPCARKL
jgi:hypothetical protein